jgi:hypothetical protein
VSYRCNPVVTLNRAVALAQVEEPTAELTLLETAAADPRLADHHRVRAVRAHLLRASGRQAEAAEEYRIAAQPPLSTRNVNTYCVAPPSPSAPNIEATLTRYWRAYHIPLASLTPFFRTRPRIRLEIRDPASYVALCGEKRDALVNAELQRREADDGEDDHGSERNH